MFQVITSARKAESIHSSLTASEHLYHDAAGQVVEDGRLQLKLLPPDDGVGQGELQEEGLKNLDFLAGGQTKTLV